MSVLRAIIVEDEPSGIKNLKYKLATHCPEVEVIAACSDGREAIQTIKRLLPDIVFLDVELGGMTGFDVLEAIPYPTFEVIFTTSYDDYAVQAIKKNALDYLLKPIAVDELLDAVAKARQKRLSETQKKSPQVHANINVSLTPNIEDESGPKRQLLAILFSDIAGYTGMMGKNEERAAACLKKFRHTMKFQVEEHFGRIIHFYGDGCLSVFESPEKAVSCALACQEIFRQPVEVPVRMGMHSGVVVLDGNEIYGDSINVTSRVESLAIPGAVLMSKRIQEDIKNQHIFTYQSLGEFELKNVAEPLEVFALTNDGLPVPKRAEIKGKTKPPSAEASNNWFNRLFGRKKKE